MLSDFKGGLISLTKICHSNFAKNDPKDFELFLDNLITYGTDYTNFDKKMPVFELR